MRGEENKLTPCPFCGKESYTKQFEDERGRQWWTVGCEWCDIKYDNGVKTEQLAIDLWNRRADNNASEQSVVSTNQQADQADGTCDAFHKCISCIHRCVWAAKPDDDNCKLYAAQSGSAA